jgi:photosystem II stability/assembly factor-like uncharacterized protein
VGGLPTGTVNGFAIHPTNPKVLYVAMREGLFRSDDGGARWTPVAHGPKGVAAVAINSKRPTEVHAATAEGGIFVSRDGGQTWEPVR